MTSFACPVCGKVLSDAAGRADRFTCPGCLSPLQNSLASNSPPALPVIPLEQDVRRDHFASTLVILIAAVLLAVGIFAVVTGGARPGSGTVFLLVAVPCGLGMLFFGWLGSRQRRTPVLPARRGDEVHAVAPARGGILDYQRPRPPPPHNGVGAALGAGLFFLGFFAGPIATLLVGGATQSASALWIIPALALFLACVPPVRALGAGMLVGIGTVVLIVGSICGGWWR